MDHAIVDVRLVSKKIHGDVGYDTLYRKCYTINDDTKDSLIELVEVWNKGCVSYMPLNEWLHR